MWDWVLSDPKSLSLASYAGLFPNIFSLGERFESPLCCALSNASFYGSSHLVLVSPSALTSQDHPNLCPCLLVLVMLPLDKPLADGTLPCMFLGDILLNCPSLQHLDVR